MEREAITVRIEVPFCTGHCVYCDKKTFGQNVGYLQRYRRALEKEIEAAGEELAEYEILSVHLHACSPSLFGVGAWDDLLRSLRTLIPGQPQWVVDLMPQELTPEMVHVLTKRQNMDRALLSLGSLSQKALRSLHRPYTQNNVDYALEFLQSPPALTLRERLGVELFYGIPGQTPEEYLEEIKRLLAIKPLQFTLRRFRNRTLPLEEQLSLSEETAWEEFSVSVKALLEEAGYQLEKGQKAAQIYALPGGLFVENSQRAKALPVMGFGIGACTTFEDVSYRNTTDLSLYLTSSDDPEKIAVF